MAEQSSFFNAVIQNGVPDRVYKAEMFARFFSSFIGNGVFPNPSTGLQVIATDNNMTIKVKIGKAWINGYYYENTDDLILNVDNADGVLHRVDSIVLRLDFINREIKTYVKKGTFSSSPVAPNLVRDSSMYELCIANIRVNVGVLSISQSNITDTRLNNELCGIVTQTVNTIDTTELYRQLQEAILEKGIDMDVWIQEAKDFFTNDFNTWFDNIKGQLDGDIAGNLLNRITDLENTVNNLKLESGSVMRPNGKNVEESLTSNELDISKNKTSIEANKTSILNLQNELNGQRLRGINIANSLLSKV